MNDDFGIKGDGKGASTLIKILAFAVYAAGGIFATLAFSDQIANFFPDDPIMNALAHLGAWANLFSILLMVWAKDYWVTGTTMTVVAWIGWGLEIVFMVLNTLASFGSDWATWWIGLSPGTPVFVVALWGVLWLLHPDHKARQQAMEFRAKARADFQAKLARSMESQGVQDILDEGAAKAAQQYAEKILGVVINPNHRPQHRLPVRQVGPGRDVPVEWEDADADPTNRRRR